MGNTIGKLFADSLEKLANKAAGKAPARQVSKLAQRTAEEIYGHDALATTSKGLLQAVKAFDHQAAPALDRKAAAASSKVIQRAALALDRKAVPALSKDVAKATTAKVTQRAAKTLVRQSIPALDKAALPATSHVAALDAVSKLLDKPAVAPALHVLKPNLPMQGVPEAGRASRVGATKLAARVKPPVTVIPPVDGKLVDRLPASTGTKEWTYVTYSASDNNLSEFVPQHLNTLEAAGSSDKVNVLAYTDRDGIADTRKYYILKDADTKVVTSPFVKASASGEMDMSDPETLRQAVSWAQKDFPSKKIWVDANDHGAPIGIFQDRTAHDPMRWPSIAKTLLDGNNGKPVDLLSVDACESQTAEVNYELRKSVLRIVASEDETFPMGMNYDQSLAALHLNPTMDVDTLAKAVADKVQMTGADIIAAGDVPGVKRVYQASITNPTLSGDMASAVTDLSSSLITALDTKRDQVMAALKGVKTLYVANHGGFDWNLRDLPTVATALKQIDDPAIKAAADKVLATTVGTGGMVLSSAAAPEEAGALTGLAIYLPLDGKLDPNYLNLAFAKDTRWVEFLKKLGQAATTPVAA